MRISIIGTGLLGEAIAQKLIQHGHLVFVYNRTRKKTDNLKKEGAYVCQSSQEVLTRGECTLLVLSDAKAIEDILFRDACDLKGKTIIQMGTIAPQESIDFAKKIKQKKGDYFECPVLGSKQEVKDGQLILMIGGTKQQFDKWYGLFKFLGPTPKFIGSVGQAAALKLALNQLIASHITAFSLSLGLVEKNKIAVTDFLEILKKSSLFAPMFEKKMPNLLKRDFSNPNFSLEHLLKDMDLFLEEAKSKKLDCSALEGIKKLILKGLKKNLGKKDYSSIFTVINS